MKQVKREAYLNFLIRHRDEQLIKVVTGVRRCGKSTLFEMYRTYLLSQGVTEAQITMINFEDIRYEELLDYHALYAAVTASLLPDKIIFSSMRSSMSRIMRRRLTVFLSRATAMCISPGQTLTFCPASSPQG